MIGISFVKELSNKNNWLWFQTSLFYDNINYVFNVTQLFLVFLSLLWAGKSFLQRYPFCVFSVQKQPPEMFYKKDVLRIFAKFIEKHLCQSLFFKKVAYLEPATLLKKRRWHRCFPVKICRISKNTFFTEHVWTTASLCNPFLEKKY